ENDFKSVPGGEKGRGVDAVCCGRRYGWRYWGAGLTHFAAVDNLSGPRRSVRHAVSTVVSWTHRPSGTGPGPRNPRQSPDLGPTARPATVADTFVSNRVIN